MECWGLSKGKSWLYWSLMLMMIHILMVRQTQGDCMEEERNALLEIKASHMKSFDSENDHFLPTWVDYGGGDCCDWERVSCNTTTGHVTELSLYNLGGLEYDDMWALNVSLFLHFKELTNLNLSYSFLDKEFMKTGLERMSSLKKLEVLDLSSNWDIDNDILPSLKTLTSLKILDLSSTGLNGNFPTNELSHLTNLEELDLSYNGFNDTPSIQACKSLSRLRRLESIDLTWNRFNKSIISCLTALPSLKTLHLSYAFSLGTSFPFQEFHNLSDLEVLFLKGNSFNGTLPMEAFTSFHHLRVLDLSVNNFVGSIPSAIKAFYSLQALSLAYNNFNDSLSDHALCELKNLHELDLSHNMLDGALPQCLNNLSSLKLLDISSNRFTGTLVPSLIAKLTSLEYVDFSDNNFVGSFSFRSFSNHSKLEVVRFGSDNDKFEVETEEHIDWIPMFQLQILVLSNCNMHMPKGRVIPGFLLHQHKLIELDMSHNSLEGQFPNWLIKNNTNLELLNVRNNLFVSMPMYRNTNMRWLDISGNHIIGNILEYIPKFYPNIYGLNLSRNALSDVIPSSFGDLNSLWILDLSNNELSGEVPKGLFTNLSELYILKLSKNNLCGQVLSGNLTLGGRVYLDNNHFTGKIGIMSKGNIQYLTLLDISNNFFKGEIPEELGLLTQLRALNMSHNQLSGPIPMNFSNLTKLESLDLSSNGLTGNVPSELVKLTFLSKFSVSHNNLSGRIPQFTAQFGTFSKDSYEGNPLLCGPPLEKKCATHSQVTNSSAEENNEKWYDIDMTYFYASSGSTCVVLFLGFVTLLCINPYWRKKWLDWVGLKTVCLHFITSFLI